VAEDPTVLALEALRSRVDAFRSAVAVALEEIRTFTAQQRGASEYGAEKAVMELGPFAVGRIDSERFAALMGDSDETSPEAFAILDQAQSILAEFVGDDDLHRLSVEPGGDLRDAVKDTLSEIGRIFGAARAVDLARSGRFDPDEHVSLLGSLPFRRWNRTERQLAPPLVVEVGAEDLVPAGLGEFLDGTMKIVLVVKGPTTPAPLARLITPGTFVVQTADPADLGSLATSRHPGVGLLFDEERSDQARFVHDPDAGSVVWKRLLVKQMPETPEVGRGRRSPSWLEDLAHLKALAKAPVGAADLEGVLAAQPSADEEAAPADQLAAWLLSQTLGQ
jgi:hypothetical protein